jgi:hypothetical protein
MGGPCDTAFQGNTSEEIMNKGAAHVTEMAATGDEGHKKALEMMQAAQTDPALAKQWGDKFEADYAALPEDQ